MKYSLGKATAGQVLPLKPDQGNRWDLSQIKVGQWFSATSYYRVNEITDSENVKVVETRDANTDITMARDILETEMHSGLAYDKEEKVTRTELVKKLLTAGESVFTISSTKKVDDKHVKNVLS